MARSIISPRLIRGQLLFQVADVLFPTFAAAALAWLAAEADRLEAIDTAGGGQ